MEFINGGVQASQMLLIGWTALFLDGTMWREAVSKKLSYYACTASLKG
jgi:hypothetical protein